jgi:hypothetical protein
MRRIHRLVRQALARSQVDQWEGTHVTSTRRISIATGVLFILATAASLSATALAPALTGSDYLSRVADHPHQLAVAALLYLIAAGGSVGIAIALYPVLKNFDAALAMGSVVFRTVEAVFYTAGVVGLLSVLSLGQEFASAPAADRAAYQTMGDSLSAGREHAALAGVFAFTLGAFMYYVVFYRSRLIPRWLSAWGCAGAALMLTACLLALFSNSMVTGYVALAAPIGVQEIVFAVWLLVKGFNPSVLSVMSSDGPAASTISGTTVATVVP